MPIASSIDQEYEDDPRQAFYTSLLTRQQPATSSPLVAGLQGIQPLIAMLLQRRLQNERKERKQAYNTAASEAIKGLPPGAGAEELARAYAASGNPDLASDSTDILLKAITGRTSAKYATTKGFDAENRPYVTSDTGDVKFIEATREPERQVPINLGDRYGVRGERTGTISPMEGGEVGVSPTAVYSAGQSAVQQEANRDQRASEGAANRADRGQEQGVQFNYDEQGRPTLSVGGTSLLGGGKSLTEEQGKATALSLRAQPALEQLDLIENKGYRPGVGTQIKQAAGEATGSKNRFINPLGQKYEQASTNFLTAILRKESGAAITEEEYKVGRAQYFVMPGDSEEVIAQKKQNRQTAARGLATQTGPGGKYLMPESKVGASDLTPTEEPTYKYFKNRKGLSDAGAFAMSRNITTESNHRTDARGDGGKARGLAQWHPDRWAKFEEWGRKNGIPTDTKQAQMDYMIDEGQNYPGFEALKGNDPAAIKQFIKNFEGYGVEGSRFEGLDERAGQSPHAAKESSPPGKEQILEAFRAGPDTPERREKARRALETIGQQ